MGRVVRDYVLGAGGGEGEGVSVGFRVRKIGRSKEEVGTLESVVQDLLGGGGEHGERKRKGNEDVRMKDVE